MLLLCGKPCLDTEDAEINDKQSLLSKLGLMEKDIGHVKGKSPLLLLPTS